MKKLILSILFILCLSFQASALNMALLTGGQSDPCTTMGASGTYSFWANADYPGDVHYACQDSGASAVDASDEVAGVAVVGGMIDGTYGYLLDAADEHIRWSNSDTTLDADAGGYASFDVTVPASTTGDTALFEIYATSQDYLAVYFENTNSRIIFQQWGVSGITSASTAVGSVDDGATQHIQISWGANPDHNEVKIDSDAGDCDVDDYGGFETDFISIAVGDDQVGLATITNAWKVDNIVIKSGYVDLCP